MRSLEDNVTSANEPSPKALTLAKEKISYTDTDPKVLKVFGTRFVYAEVADAVEANERLTNTLARMLDEFAAEQQILNVGWRSRA